MSWEGDQMLHVYVCDYLRKRGYSQAALALRLEAGLEPDRKVPIDAPQSLLFEWWVVFWEVFASRSLGPKAAVNGGLSADALTYTSYRPPGLPEARSVQNIAPAYPAGAQQIEGPVKTMTQQPPFTRRMSQAGPSSEASSSMQAGLSTRASPPDQQNLQQQQRRLSVTTIPQLDLEASQKLGLARPASRVVIQQCMDMMNLGAKEIDQLTTEEKRALTKRVTHLQTAQNDAQVRLARLHGLQPPKPLVPGSMSMQAQVQGQSMLAPMQQEAASTAEAYNNQPGQKRKGSPNSDADRSRIAMVGPSVQVQDHRSFQQQPGPAPSMRRPSYSTIAAVSSATSPLTPSNAAGLSFSQVSPHPMMQHSPASSAPTPSAHAMNPPHTRRPSVFGPEPTSLSTTSPHKAGMYASGLAGPSVSPLNEWNGLSITASQQQLHPTVLPLQQQQQPVVLPSSHDPSSHQVQLQPAFNSRPPMHPSQTYSGLPSATPQQMAGQKEAAPALFQLDLPPRLAKPSVFGSAASSGDAEGVDGYAAAALNGFAIPPQLAEGSAPPTPFTDLEYDFNDLLSNSTQLSRAGGS
ncbi:hypothetical protein [Sporisorium scitamineum]|nr:hypothetical protein [Sporisorium scitamineum]